MSGCANSRCLKGTEALAAARSGLARRRSFLVLPWSPASSSAGCAPAEAGAEGFTSSASLAWRAFAVVSGSPAFSFRTG